MINREYFGLKLSQRGQGNAVDFFVFVASSREVSQWAGIRRVGQHQHGTQRVLKSTRVKAIQRFLSRSAANTIPVGVIIAFNGQVEFTNYDQQIAGAIVDDVHNRVVGKESWGKISFEYDPASAEHEKPALIVDGQHRIKGMAAIGNEEIPVLVVALMDADPKEQAFQFVVINNKAQKVPTDNVKAIVRLIGQDEEELSNRLRTAGVNYGKYPATLGDINEEADSPFHNLLNWPLSNTQQAFIDLTAIESCIRYIKTQLPIIKEDEETVKEVFLAIWRAVKAHYPHLWTTNREEFRANPTKNKFLSKVNINALNEFLVDKVGNAWMDDKFDDLYDMGQIERYCNDIVLRQITQEYWERNWSFNLQDNAIVRNKIKEDILRIAQNLKSDKEWYDGVSLAE